MKTKLQTSAAISALILSIVMLAGQTTYYPTIPKQNPGPAFDPTTGQPINPPSPDSDWKDPSWKDPGITLTNITYDNLPLSEVARDLRERFKEQFDVILPDESVAVGVGPGGPVSAGDVQMQLQLKGVNASELFSAMNLLFENDQTPLRWELKVIGHRQIALLRALVDWAPKNAPQAAPPRERRVYFVGDLIGDEKTGGMSMEQIVKTVTEVWQMADTTNGNIQFHKDAQLLVVSGTPGQVDFVQQTLVALRDRQRHAQEAAKADGSKDSPAIKR